MNINQIIQLIAPDMAHVNSEIRTRLKSKITLINKLAQYIIDNKGKQIRPMITILSAKALQYKKKQHITIAALIEFIHTAALLHDDVVDHSCMRRGQITTNVIFGNSANILVGDFIYTKAFQMMTELKSLRILSLMSDAVNIIAEGEIKQLMNCNNPNITIDNYMKIIYSKTARLFEVASQASAILAKANIFQEKALRNYGRYVGVAFQLIDDLLDYDASETILGKNIGNDLNEGKLTLPLLHTIHHSTPKQASFIRNAIKTGNNRHLLNKILSTMREYGSLEYTKKCATIRINKAISCLKILPTSPYKKALKSLATNIVQRIQ
ncbi:octaprenyl diphosphate synthase [Candidatus Blochmannia ocreatus (nom. nud.)]|uniref:Octaprenyl diphosphate synthase n=1 Tax=Candidatus Blochmannia ocreatus (nom. nud.) TaxID=251538 RepID=A0ABY4SV03_9ENTR|nr:octaprenyl diphosphate synthase [Candidatus Blochmannia ocreatus]URJ25177.1 octaprenyl diphosphate synthase [Candidatus Blochmannia ocreatus]